MSEVLGRLNAAIKAQGPDKLWVDSRDALAAAYQTISDMHERLAESDRLAQIRLDRLMQVIEGDGSFDRARGQMQAEALEEAANDTYRDGDEVIPTRWLLKRAADLRSGGTQ